MQSYHKRKLLDWTILLVVVLIASVVIALSFHNTVKLATELKLNPYLAAGLVEILFASLLFIRGRQRATQRHVPTFLEIGYFISLAFVTAVNMYGLSQENMIIGPIIGIAISGAMWLMETTLVWLWTDSHKPYKKNLSEIKREAKIEIKEMKEIQRIEWMKWEASKPDLKLIQDARTVEEKRKKVVGDGLPEFFLQKTNPTKELVAELQETEPKTLSIQDKESKSVVPIQVPMRQIGFHVETKSTPNPPLFQPNLEAREKAIEMAKQLERELGRIPKKRELMERGLTDHYSRVALTELKKQ